MKKSHRTPFKKENQKTNASKNKEEEKCEETLDLE